MPAEALEALPPSARTTLVIMLGASEWPYFPGVSSSLAFANAARKLRAYFLQHFALPVENLLDLFDVEKCADDLDKAIKQFLEYRTQALMAEGNPARDVLFYFVGYGAFVGLDSKFYLLVRRTREESPAVSGLIMENLARTLLSYSHKLRHFIVLDCSFVASAFQAFQVADPSTVAIVQMADIFRVPRKIEGYPRQGITMLTSSEHKASSLILPDHSGTLFSTALLAVLVGSSQAQQAYLSLHDVRDKAQGVLWAMPTANAPRPVVYSPDQSEGDVAAVPFFPVIARSTLIKDRAFEETVPSFISDRLAEYHPPQLRRSDGRFVRGGNPLINRMLSHLRPIDSRLFQREQQALRSDIFSFFRRTPYLFYEDLSMLTALNNAPPAWICGNLHLENLGVYKGNNQLCYFNINNFDEATLAPCTWDLARFLVNVQLSAHTMKLSHKNMLILCCNFLEVYANTLKKERIHQLDESNVHGFVKAMLLRAKQSRRGDLLEHYTILLENRRKLKIDGEYMYLASEHEKAQIAQILKSWGERQSDAQFFTLLDAAHYQSGIENSDNEHYIVLMEGRGSPDTHYLLDLKVAGRSSSAAFSPCMQPQWANETERVITVQRWIQGVPPALLAPLEHNGKVYILREIQAAEARVPFVQLERKTRQLENLVTSAAKVIAWGQLRSAGRQGAAEANIIKKFVQESNWQSPLLYYVHTYATIIEEYYYTFSAM